MSIKKLIHTARYYLKQPLLKGSAIIFAGTFIGNFLSYLYHLAVGSRLTPQDYGLLESFIALTYFFGVPVQAFTFSIVKTITQSREEKIPSIVRSLEKKAFSISFVFWIIMVALLPVLRKTLQFEGSYLYLFFSLQAFFVFIPVVYTATLQAKLKFLHLTLLGVVVSSLKILTALLFVSLGLRVGGALAGFLVTGIGTVVIGWYLVNHFWPAKKDALLELRLPTHFWRYSSLSLFVNLFLISLYSIDIILARYFLSSYDSGIYSATSVLGKIILFVTNTVMIVAFPLFTKHRYYHEKIRKIYSLALILVTSMVAVGIFGYHLMPDFITSVLYKAEYIETAQFLPLFSIFIGLLSVFVLSIQFLLALEKNACLWFAGFAALLQIILIVINHATVSAIIQSSIASIAITLMLVLAYNYRLLYAKRI
jgi:O-antigen/teichoic acid export membrane protein